MGCESLLGGLTSSDGEPIGDVLDDIAGVLRGTLHAAGEPDGLAAVVLEGLDNAVGALREHAAAVRDLAAALRGERSPEVLGRDAAEDLAARQNAGKVLAGLRRKIAEAEGEHAGGQPR